MTQRSDLKKLVRARQAKTGESYTTALRHVRAQASTPQNETEESMNDSFAPPPTAIVDDVPPLLLQLRASPFAIQVGRMSAVGRSASYEVAMAQAHDRLVNPKFYAESGAVSMTISEQQLEHLVKVGAARDTEIQIIRTFHNDHGATFSDRCSACKRWIWCGREEREATCVCGQPYRVVFDLSHIHHWTQKQDWRCVDCGTRFGMTEVSEGRNPWGHLHDWQIQCKLCQDAEDKRRTKRLHAVVTRPVFLRLQLHLACIEVAHRSPPVGLLKRRGEARAVSAAVTSATWRRRSSLTDRAPNMGNLMRWRARSRCPRSRSGPCS